MPRKILIAVALFVAVSALTLWLFWPQTLVVNGPVLNSLMGRQVDTPTSELAQSRLRVAHGLGMGLFAEGLKNPRMLEITPTGDLIVSETRNGSVIVLHRDDNEDGRADGKTILFSGLTRPHGLALMGDTLFVAGEDRVIAAPYDAAARAVGESRIIFDGLPTGGNHRTRTLKIGPDGWLYLTTGSTCNVCVEEQPFRATMIRMRPDGTGAEIFAEGLRNTVGFDWNPADGQIYGTDNGRDLLGDDVPDDELNRITAGAFYGWPYAYGNKVPDPDIGAESPEHVARSVPPVHGFGAHVAPLGIDFITGANAPSALKGQALVAEHGSWNRSELAGYKVVALEFGADGTVTESDFITGFERDEDVMGRPVDLEEGPDGSIYLSDDYAGVIWRIGGADIPLGSGVGAEKTPLDPLAELGEAERARLIGLGALVFATNGCGACHIPDAAPEGQAVKEVAGLGSRFDIAALEALLKTPPATMPTPEITDAERRALAVYLLAVAP